MNCDLPPGRFSQTPKGSELASPKARARARVAELEDREVLERLFQLGDFTHDYVSLAIIELHDGTKMQVSALDDRTARRKLLAAVYAQEEADERL